MFTQHLSQQLGIQKYFLCTALIFCSARSGHGQGCSDAGVCSVNGLHSGSSSTSSWQFSFSQSLGWASTNGSSTFIFTNAIESSIRIHPKFSVAAKLPFQWATGDLATVGDWGSVTVSGSYILLEQPFKKIVLIAGSVLPLNNSNISKNGRSLPMEYQSSLGTRDVLIGISYSFNPWTLSIGFQRPTNRNENGFLRTDWVDTPSAQNYFDSNQLKRGNDLTLRAEKRIEWKKSTLFLSILPVLRLQKDEIIVNNNSVPLAGSNQLTINMNVSWESSLGQRWKIRLTEGNPILWRKTRADGLTRVFVLTGSLLYSF